jgi:polyphosphate kinase 2 (PPK2 family)
MPERGQIGIFNRSYYEEVLVVRVHPQLLENQKLPKPLVTKHIWQERFEDINTFERYATRNGIAIVKFFLHLSKKEQKRRFLERLDTSEKNWKFSAADVRERQCWDQYQEAYEKMIQHTATDYAPWYVVPADNKWFTRLVVVEAVTNTLKAMNLKYPKVSEEEKAALAQARKQLESE